MTLAILAACTVGDAPIDESPVAFAPSPNDESAFAFFVGKGLTDEQAAGIVGNLDQESQMNPEAVQSGGLGRGIAQWSEGGRWDVLVQFAADRGASPWALATQLEFLWHELEHVPAFGLAELRAASTVADATIVFQDRFERCGVCHTSQRIDYAQRAYAAYAGRFSTQQFAFQANSGRLFVGPDDTGLGMMAGTSPAASGRFVAFQANTGALWVVGPDGATDLGLGMMAGTSPAIATRGGDHAIAFQANTGALFVRTSSGIVDTGLGMQPGTSPAIAMLADGNYAVAFQANTTGLFVTGPSIGIVDTGLGMASSTNPSITATEGAYKVAFQANTGALFTFGPDGIVDTGLGMMPGTSPAIRGRTIAFQANTGALFTVGRDGIFDTGLGMMPGTSPAIGTRGEVLFQANTGALFSVGPGIVDTGLGMAAGTSPSGP